MTHPAESAVTIDDLEQVASSGAQTKLDVKLEGDNVPEGLRGKTMAEALEYMSGVEKALRTSEESRKSGEEGRGRLEAEVAALKAAATRTSAQPSPETKDEPKELTDEELQELYDKEPLKAIKIMNQQAEYRVLNNLEKRVTPLVTGNADVAEQNARQKYKLEFELFGDDIDKVLQRPDLNRMALSSAKGWDDLITYVRGQAGNVDKLIAYRTAEEKKRQEQEIQAAAAAGVPASLTSTGTRPPTPTAASGDLDDTEKEVARNLNMTEDEYKKWKAVG